MALRISDEDAKLNPGESYARDLFDRNLFDAEKKGNNTENANPDSISKVNDSENSPQDTGGGWKNAVTAAANIAKPGSGKAINAILSATKNKGPLVSIIVTIVVIIFAVLGIFLPSTALINMKESLFGSLNDSSAALTLRTSRMYSYKFRQATKTVKNGFSFSSDGTCNIRCKMGSINDTMLRNLKANGFDVETTEGTGVAKGRYIIETMTLPEIDGVRTKVTNGAEFATEMKKVKSASVFKKVFNSSTKYYMNSKFGTILREKFGLDKLSKIKSDLVDSATGKVKSVKESINTSIREALGLPAVDVKTTNLTPEEKLDINPKYKKAVETINGFKGSNIFNSAVTKASDVVGYVCTSYNVSKGITFATKAAKVAAFAGLAMIYLNAADEQLAGDIDSDTLSVLNNNLTEPDENGQTATSSSAYRSAVYGDSVVLSTDEQKYSLASSNAIIATLTTISAAIAIGGTVAISSIRNVCKTSGNVIISTGGAIVETCPEELIAAAGLAVETVGVGSALSLAVCVAKIVVKQAALSAVFSSVLGSVIGLVASNSLPPIDENTHGAALGSILKVSMAEITGGTSASYGLKAGNTAEITQYVIDTAAIKKQEAEIAAYEAKDTPFDITNKYSFLGSIANTIGLSSFYNSSFLSSISNVLSIIPKSLATLTSSAGAEANKKAAQFDGKCADAALSSVGVDGDAFCNASYVMSSSEMNADIDTVTSWMISNKYVSETTGDVIDDPNFKTLDVIGTSLIHKKNDYKEYLDNCANRVAPLGETSGAVEDYDYEWEIGLKCSENSEMMSNFRVYTMDKAISDTLDE